LDWAKETTNFKQISMNYEIVGKLRLKEEVQNVSATFKKREFVVEVENERNSDWNDFVKFQLTQDRCSLIDAFAEGQALKVTFNVRGRKWEKDGRVSYFNSLEAWRVDLFDKQAVSASQEPLPNYSTTEIPQSDEGDDLPF
jgi:hypothetical protein